jgi:hypothetical protein
VEDLTLQIIVNLALLLHTQAIKVFRSFGDAPAFLERPTVGTHPWNIGVIE